MWVRRSSQVFTLSLCVMVASAPALSAEPWEIAPSKRKATSVGKPNAGRLTGGVAGVCQAVSRGFRASPGARAEALRPKPCSAWSTRSRWYIRWSAPIWPGPDREPVHKRTAPPSVEVARNPGARRVPAGPEQAQAGVLYGEREGEHFLRPPAVMGRRSTAKCTGPRFAPFFPNCSARIVW